ncbi:MAG: hypothetical protein A3H36_09200 [Chloroflexi bacterium RIFCSPLOWO2_02_FULL_71_16]|nr:MAG: hypothetical protein A3H36_09200 [Chloroflexi bacterium RIFCSPLOWO2_02_FULL_71_16]
MLAEPVRVERQVREARRKDAPRGAPREVGRERVPFQHSAAVLLDELPGGDPLRRLVDARPANATGQREEAPAGAAAPAVPAPPVRATLQDRADPVHRLDVLDQRGAAEEARLRGVGRALARIAATPLDALEHRRLLAADIGSRSAADPDPHRGDRRGFEGVQLPAEDLAGERVFVPDVDVRLARADRPASEEQALEHAVRIALEADAVLERARLALVGVQDGVLGRGLSAHDPPLAARRETRPAEAAQAGGLEGLDDLRPVALAREARPQQGVATLADVLIEGHRAGRADPAVLAGDRRPHLVRPGIPDHATTGLDRGRDIAASDAGASLDLDADRGGDRARAFARSGEDAGKAVACPDPEPRRRGRAVRQHVEPRVEGRDLVGLGERDAHLGGEGGEVRVPYPAVAVLDGVEVLEQEVAVARRASERLADLGQRARIDLGGRGPTASAPRSRRQQTVH